MQQIKTQISLRLLAAFTDPVRGGLTRTDRDLLTVDAEGHLADQLLEYGTLAGLIENRCGFLRAEKALKILKLGDHNVAPFDWLSCRDSATYRCFERCRGQGRRCFGNIRIGTLRLRLLINQFLALGCTLSQFFPSRATQSTRGHALLRSDLRLPSVQLLTGP